MGIPIIVAGQVTGLDPFHIGQMAGRQLPLLSVLVPFWLILIMDGVRGVRETWPAILVAGGSFAIVQFFTANFVGRNCGYHGGPCSAHRPTPLPEGLETAPHLPFRDQRQRSGTAAPAQKSTYTAGQIARAWSPFLILTVFA